MENQKPVSDEIDLGQLFEKLGKFFYNGWINFMRFLALIRNVPTRNKKLFITTILLSLSIGTSYYFVRKAFHKEIYKTTMILNSYSLNKKLVDNAVEKLNLLTKEKERLGLAEVLHISDTLAQYIESFDARPFVREEEVTELEVLRQQLKNAKSDDGKGINDKEIEKVIQRIQIENRHSFEIEVNLYDSKVIREVQSALVNYFKDNDYVKKRIEIERINRKEKKEKLTRDLHRLDSLKAIIYENYKSMAAAQGKQGSNNVYLNDKSVTNPVEIYNQDIMLYNEYQAINSEIYLQPDFEVVDGFVQLHKPTSEGLARMLFNFFIIGVVASYLLVALIAFNKYLASLSV